MYRPAIDLNRIPNTTGIYFFKNRKGRILYIGKANHLRDRIRQYLQGHDSRPLVAYLLREVHRVDWIVTKTPLEALILEAQMIRRHQPPYNTLLKDTRNLPTLRVTVQERFPRIEVAYRVEGDGAQYFGPFLSIGQARRVLEFVTRVFRLRACDLPLDGTRRYPVCLLYHIQRCSGPCAGSIDEGAYRRDVDAACRFLAGDRDEVIAEFEARMRTHAQRMEFEAAAFYRDAIQTLRAWTPSVRVLDPQGRSVDMIGVAAAGPQYALVVFMVRQGVLVDRREFLWEHPYGGEGPLPWDDPEWWHEVLPQFYLTVHQPPDEVWLAVSTLDGTELEAWMAHHFQRPVRIRPRASLDPDEVERLEWVVHQAQTLLHTGPERAAEDPYETLRMLQHLLNLPSFPYRIEGFDVSNIQGQWNVGSLVVFEGGRPKRRDYRRFRVRTVHGPDDYASMREIVYRRYTGSLRDQLPMPDLVLIDGGPGQLRAAREALQAAGCAHLPTIALAKRQEVVYVPDVAEPIRWPHHWPVLRLLQHIRDEAHRWAITYYRRLHAEADIHVTLTEVPGIGSRLARRLLAHFPSWEALQRASVDDLARVVGRCKAVTLYEWLHKS